MAAPGMGAAEPPEVAALAKFRVKMRSLKAAVGYVDYKVEVKGANYSSFCNLFLVGENLALTASHCISTQAQCDTATAYFSEDGDSPTHHYACKKVLGIGAPYDDNLKNQDDFSLLELEGKPGSDLLTAPLHFMQPTEGQKWLYVFLPKYDTKTHIKDNISRSLSICMARRSHVESEIGSWEIRPLPNSDEPCHLMRGNSGGPIFNIQGKIIGIATWLKAAEGSVGELNDNRVIEARGPTIQSVTNKLASLRLLYPVDAPKNKPDPEMGLGTAPEKEIVTIPATKAERKKALEEK